MATLEERLAKARQSVPAPAGAQELDQRLSASAAPPVDAAATPSPSGGFGESAGRFARSMLNDLSAGLQGTSPAIVEDPKNFIGLLAQDGDRQFALTPDGGWRDVDPMTDVILADPETGKPSVYLRSAATDERLLSLARIMSFGTSAGPVGGATVAGARGQGLLRAFDDAGVDPTLAAVNQGRAAKTVQNTLSEVPTSAGVVDRRVAASLDQTEAAVRRSADEFGAAGSRVAGGEAAQAGAQRFVGAADDISLPDDMVTQIIRTPTRNANLGEQFGFALKAKALYQRVDGFFKAGDAVPVDGAVSTLTGANKKFDLAELGADFISPRFAKWGNLISENNGVLSYGDLRLFRTEVGRLLRSPQAVFDTTLDVGQLKQLYASLSDDLLKFAATKGDDAVKSVREADAFYLAGADRIRTALGKILAPGQAGEATYDLLVRKAGETGAANIKQLQAIRKSIPDDEWGEVASAVIRNLGKPKPGATNLVSESGFSAATFVSNYARLSEGGREILFGGAGRRAQRDALDNLAKVVSAQREVQRLHNASGSGRVGLTGALGVLAVFEPVNAAIAAVGSNVAARLVMSPDFVRWIGNAPTVSWQSQQWASHIAKLRIIASQTPGLAPEVNQLTTALEARGVDVPPGTDALLKQKLRRLRLSAGIPERA